MKQIQNPQNKIETKSLPSLVNTRLFSFQLLLRGQKLQELLVLFCTLLSCVSRCKMGRKVFSASQQLLLE